MVDLNKINISAHRVDPVQARAETVNAKQPAEMAELFDTVVGRLGNHFLEESAITPNEEGVLTLTLKLKGVGQLAYDASEIHSGEALSASFNEDIAVGMLTALFKEQGGELEMISPSEIKHSKSGLAVRVSLANYIHQGVFAFAKFKDDLVSALQKRNAALCPALDRFALPIALKGAYPPSFNLTLWFNDSLCLFSSKHPDLLSLEGMLRRSMESR